MKKTFYICSLLLLFMVSVTAQNRNLQRITDVFFDTMGRNFTALDFLENFEGSPYQSTKFLLGNVYINGEVTASNLPLRYNIYGDEIQVKRNLEDDDDTIKALTKSPDIYVVIFNNQFMYLSKQNGLKKGGYYQVLHEGKNMTLYKKLQKRYMEGKKAKTSFERDIPAKFKDDNLYFIKYNNGHYKEVPSSKSKRIKLLSEVNGGIKNYLKTSKINISDEKGLLKAFKYCDANML